MQFKNPELLYALFLLIIPILIHLFQLRRFQKVEFTNVKFLKTVKLQTRKSSQLKKWLTLLTRLLLLACTIIAFAQPFIPNTEDFNEAQESVIYLDNSFSMEANGRNGSLLNEAVQDIIKSFDDSERLSLFTNDKTFRNTTIKALKNDLIQLSHSTSQLSYDAAFLKGKQLFTANDGATKNLILVSDFQQKQTSLKFEQDSSFNISLVQPKSNLMSNVSIDSVFISNTTSETLDLTILLKNHFDPIDTIAISLYNDDSLLAKSAVSIEKEAETTFSVANNTILNGTLVIEDAGLQYDNKFYFNINLRPKIKVLSINGNTNDNFLKRIYTEDEFDYSSANVNALNFNLIPDQNLVVLNELETISNALTTALVAFSKDGGQILIIPSSKINLDSYNQTFKQLLIPSYSGGKQNEKRITKINYDHPLLQGAFYSKVTNFQYPKVNTAYGMASNANAILTYEDGSAFLSGLKNIFVFTAALNNDNSNFKSSQLIVPVIYNIGFKSIKLPRLYYTIGQPNTIAINTTLGQDEILTLESQEVSVIPMQKSYSKSVVLTTENFPEKAGILSVKNKAAVLQNLSFNYSRDESVPFYFDLSPSGNLTLEEDLSTAIANIKSNTNVNALWKWFVIFALVFLIIEMLILKYLK